MRGAVGSTLVLLALLPAGLASAGPFGGFSRDGSRYLVDEARVCAPVAAARGLPRCEKKSADQVAQLGFGKGAVQRGAGATVAVQATGTRLVVRSADGKTVRAQWDAGDPIGAVSAVYLSDGGKLVAIEYAARIAGRSAPQVVVLALSPAPAASGAAPTPPTRTAPTPPTRTAPTRSPPGTPTPPGAPATPTAAAPVPDDPRVTARVAAGDKELARKKWKKAEAEYRAALAAGDHPAARYGLAAALVGQSRAADAVAELTALSRSTHPQAPRWLVEARLGTQFTRLRGEAGFRRAVGIDPDPAHQPSAYERLLGLGGHWEQTGTAGTACQQPTVDLRLDRKSQKFQLVIRNRCQGEDETTRLSGTWTAEATAILRLRFPNADGPEEGLSCQLDAAPDRSGEDRLSCTLEELTFAMRVVRR